METHLRLAERQGVLQAKHLSPLQSYALVLLRWLDAKQHSRDLANQIKAAMIATGRVGVKDLYPEWFPVEKEEEREEKEENVTYDYSAVEWKGGSDAISDYEALMAKVAQNSKVTITAEGDVGGGWL